LGKKCLALAANCKNALPADGDQFTEMVWV
jgi:hypothetical protein